MWCYRKTNCHEGHRQKVYFMFHSALCKLFAFSDPKENKRPIFFSDIADTEWVMLGEM